MAPHTPQKNPHSLLLLVFLLSFSSPFPIHASAKKLQEIVPQAPTTEIKCGTCPCVNPCCQQSLPPPPPSAPPPPPPRFTYNCNPVPLTPPQPRFYYVTGVPGQLYTAGSDDRWTFFSNSGPYVVSISLLLFGNGLLLALFII